MVIRPPRAVVILIASLPSVSTSADVVLVVVLRVDIVLLVLVMLVAVLEVTVWVVAVLVLVPVVEVVVFKLQQSSAVKALISTALSFKT